MKIGDKILCPVFTITHIISPTIFEKETLFNIVTIRGKNYLRTEVTKEDVGRPYRDILLKFKMFCTGLSVATVGHFWVEDILMDESLKVIWGEKKAILLLKGKELLNSGPDPLRVEQFRWGKQLIGWIALEYPRVFLYHSMGLYLLRVPTYGDVYPDALLNFFKIVEIVTYKRTMKKAQLKVILAEARNLDIKVLDEREIKKYYEIRGRDVAHDWGKSKPIDREDVINCKHLAEEFIISDRHKRIKKVESGMGVKP